MPETKPLNLQVTGALEQMAFDLQEVNQLSWRFIQNFMLMQRNICINNLKDAFPALRSRNYSPIDPSAMDEVCLVARWPIQVAMARSDAIPLFSASQTKAYAEGYKKSSRRRNNKPKQTNQKGKTDKSGNKQNPSLTVTTNAEVRGRQVSNPDTTTTKKGRGRGKGKKKQ